MIRPALAERAYQLAQSGECADIGEVRKRLKAEGYADVAAHLHSTSLSKAVRQLCKVAHKDVAEGSARFIEATSAAGVISIDENGEGPGVRLRKERL